MTGQELANAALELLCVIPAGGSPTSADATTALNATNRMVRSWNAQGLTLYAMARAPYTWTAAASSRTIGPSGTLSGSTIRPVDIAFAKVIPAGATSELPVHLLSRGEYAAIPNKAQTADYFTSLLYEPTPTNGTLIPWPVPTSAPTLVLHTKTLLSVVALDTEISAPPEYEEPLVYQLAKRLQTPFGARLSGDDLQIANESFATLKRNNIRIPDPVRMPAEFRGQRGSVSASDFDAGNF